MADKQEVVEVNNVTYVVEKLKHGLDTHDQKVTKDQLTVSPILIEHSHIVAVPHAGKYQVLVGSIPDTDKEFKIKVVTKYNLKRAIYVSPEAIAKAEAEARAAQTSSDFRNKPRFSDDNKTRRDFNGSRFNQQSQKNRYA